MDLIRVLLLRGRSVPELSTGNYSGRIREMVPVHDPDMDDSRDDRGGHPGRVDPGAASS
jgi:hypothetical protein